MTSQLSKKRSTPILQKTINNNAEDSESLKKLIGEVLEKAKLEVNKIENDIIHMEKSL